MKFVSGQTPEERRLVTGLQAAAGRKQDNSIGPDALVGFAQVMAPNLFPFDVDMYGCKVFVGKNVNPFDPNSSLRNWGWTISGGYSWEGKPSSILIANGKTIRAEASQAWLGYPESVIVEYLNGAIKSFRVMTDADIPDRKNVKWAIGGAGLLGNFNPKAEGFCKFRDKNGVYRDYSNVFRYTTHTIFGNSGPWKYGITYTGGSNKLDGVSINNFMIKNFKLDNALKLDGGHIAARNGPNGKVNIDQVQAYAIQFF